MTKTVPVEENLIFALISFLEHLEDSPYIEIAMQYRADFEKVLETTVSGETNGKI